MADAHPLRGIRIDRCATDLGLRLFASDGSTLHAELRIDEPFVARTTAGDLRVDPTLPWANSEALAGETIEAFEAWQDGALRMKIGHVTVLVSPGADYEAWSLVRTDGVRMVSLPGGGLAT